MDREKLRIALLEKTGIRIDTDDPVFAIVALNQLVLDEYTAQVVEALDGKTGKLNVLVGQLLDAAEKVKSNLNGSMEAAKYQIGRAGEDEIGKLRRRLHETVTEVMTDTTAQNVGLLASAREELEQAKRALKSSDSGVFWPTVAATLVGAVLAGALALLGWGYMQKTGVLANVETDRATAEHIANGQLLERAWPKLDEATRRTIQRAAGK